MGVRAIVLIAGIMYAAAGVWAAQPPRFNYQAKLSDGDGVPLQGSHTVFFSIYQGGTAGAAGSGAQVYQESAVHNLFDGVLNHTVGTGTPTSGTMTKDLFRFDGDMFLEVAVDVDTNVTLPRSRLESVPFAINAANGDTRIPISTPGFVISQPGSYYLTQNINGGTGQNGIVIDADNVTLDLNGYALIGGGASVRGIRIITGRKNIAVRNGSIRNWPTAGLDGSLARNLLIEKITAADNGFFQIHAGEGSVVLDCTVLGNSPSLGLNSVGIAAGDGSTIAFCTSSRNSQDGMQVDDGCSVINCTVSKNLHDGIEAGDGNSITGCTFSRNGDTGIRILGFDNLVEDNMVTADNLIDSIGIHVDPAAGSGNTIRANRCTAGLHGLKIETTNNHIVDNDVRGNVDNYSIVVGNQLDLLLSEIPETIDWPANVTLAGSLTAFASSGSGITVNANNVTIDLGGHSLTGNFTTQNGITAVGRERLTVRNGTIGGWSQSGIAASTSTEVLCENVKVVANGLHGIDVGAGSIISDCIADGNGTAAGANNGTGIRTAGFCVIWRCTSRGNDGNGFFASNNCVVSDCNAANNTGDQNNGFQVGAGGVVTNCSASNNGEDGFFGASVTIRNCFARGNGNDGIHVTQASQVIGNECYQNGVTEANGAGIHASGAQNRIESNHVVENHVGIDVDVTSSLIAGNTVAASVAAQNYTQIVAGNLVGPILNSAAGVTGNTNPQANFILP